MGGDLEKVVVQPAATNGASATGHRDGGSLDGGSRSGKKPQQSPGAPPPVKTTEPEEEDDGADLTNLDESLPRISEEGSEIDDEEDDAEPAFPRTPPLAAAPPLAPWLGSSGNATPPLDLSGLSTLEPEEEPWEEGGELPIRSYRSGSSSGIE